MSDKSRLETAKRLDAVLARAAASRLRIGVYPHIPAWAAYGLSIADSHRDREYRQRGFRSFAAMLRDEGLSRANAYRLMRAGRAFLVIYDDAKKRHAALGGRTPELGEFRIPAYEMQVRSLANAPANTIVTIWREAVAAAGGKNPTSAQVADACEAWGYPSLVRR